MGFSKELNENPIISISFKSSREPAEWGSRSGRGGRGLEVEDGLVCEGGGVQAELTSPCASRPASHHRVHLAELSRACGALSGRGTSRRPGMV